uniref:EF-hand domain-containing protein n=1 Tax=Anopheles culicifacies TaxID=139723 RepID=A0A182M3L4_9DIPT
MFSSLEIVFRPQNLPDRNPVPVNLEGHESNLPNILDHFLTYEEIKEFLARIAQLFKDKVSMEKLGETALGRDINMAVINPNAAKTVILVANMHAREWGATTSALFIISELVKNREQYLEFFDIRWMIIPLANPDGYEYTREYDRYWSKNRSPQPGGTFGVDLNANFEHMWGMGKPVDPDDRTYNGPRAFSEEETIAISAVMEEMALDTILFIDMHTYGNHIFHAWGHTPDPSPDVANSRNVAFAGADAMRAKFHEYYTVGAPSALFHRVYGTSLDYCQALAINADEKQIDFAEQLESVAYVLCGDGTVTYDKFCQIWHAKGILDKLYRLIDVDSTNLISTNQIMEFISNLTNSRAAWIEGTDPVCDENDDHVPWVVRYFERV